MKGIKKILIILLSFLTIVGGSTFGKTSYLVKADSQPNPTDVPKSIWIWNATQNLANTTTTIATLKKYNITSIYINTGYENGKQVLNSGVTGSFTKYSVFIKEAKKNNINNIEALFGDPSWSQQTTMNDKRYPQWNPLTQISEVFKYNIANKDNRFTAIHIDAEPHALQLWSTWDDKKRSQQIKELVENLKIIKKEIVAHNSKNKDKIRLVIDVNAAIPDYKLYMKDFFAVADEIVLMDYTQNQFDYLSNAIEYLYIGEKLNKKVTIGSEFQDPAVIKDKVVAEGIKKITLYNYSQEQLLSYLITPLKIFKLFGSFNGIAIHDYENFNKYMSKQSK